MKKLLLIAMLFSLMACEKEEAQFKIKIIDHTGIDYYLCEFEVDGKYLTFTDSQFNAGVEIYSTSGSINIRLLTNNMEETNLFIDFDRDCSITIKLNNGNYQLTYSY